MQVQVGRSALPARLGALLVILTLVASACDSILDSDTNFADNVRVQITGTSPGPLQLVTSTNFQIGISQTTGAETVVVIDSTVAAITLPVDRNYPFTPSYRFLVRVVNPDTTVAVPVRLRVYLDDELVNDQNVTIRTSPVQFTWRYF